MAQQGAAIIVKKKHGGHEHAHHGGAWKVAYADFVTAMMAFFLLLWLLNATSEEQRAGLADYFDPTIPLTVTSGGGAGIAGGPSQFSPDPRAGQSETGTPPRNATPLTEAGAADAPENAIGLPGDAAPETAEDDENDVDAGDVGADAAIAEASLGALGDESHVTVRTTADGLLIELVDLVDEPLFDRAGARPTAVLTDLISIVAAAIAPLPNRLQIIGHTDGAPFPPGSAYTNWELSAERANAARRLLVAAGIERARIAAVVGRAATQPAASDPADPRNRRIAIKLLTARPGAAGSP